MIERCSLNVMWRGIFPCNRRKHRRYRRSRRFLPQFAYFLRLHTACKSPWIGWTHLQGWPAYHPESYHGWHSKKGPRRFHVGFVYRVFVCLLLLNCSLWFWVPWGLWTHQNWIRNAWQAFQISAYHGGPLASRHTFVYTSSRSSWWVARHLRILKYQRRRLIWCLGI